MCFYKCLELCTRYFSRKTNFSQSSNSGDEELEVYDELDDADDGKCNALIKGLCCCGRKNNSPNAFSVNRRTIEIDKIVDLQKKIVYSGDGEKQNLSYHSSNPPTIHLNSRESLSKQLLKKVWNALPSWSSLRHILPWQDIIFLVFAGVIEGFSHYFLKRQEPFMGVDYIYGPENGSAEELLSRHRSENGFSPEADNYLLLCARFIRIMQKWGGYYNQRTQRVLEAAGVLGVTYLGYCVARIFWAVITFAKSHKYKGNLWEILKDKDLEDLGMDEQQRLKFTKGLGFKVLKNENGELKLEPDDLNKVFFIAWDLVKMSVYLAALGPVRRSLQTALERPLPNKDICIVPTTLNHGGRKMFTYEDEIKVGPLDPNEPHNPFNFAGRLFDTSPHSAVYVVMLYLTARCEVTESFGENLLQLLPLIVFACVMNSVGLIDLIVRNYVHGKEQKCLENLEEIQRSGKLLSKQKADSPIEENLEEIQRSGKVLSKQKADSPIEESYQTLRYLNKVKNLEQSSAIVCANHNEIFKVIPNSLVEEDKDDLMAEYRVFHYRLYRLIIFRDSLYNRLSKVNELDLSLQMKVNIYKSMRGLMIAFDYFIYNAMLNVFINYREYVRKKYGEEFYKQFDFVFPNDETRNSIVKDWNLNLMIHAEFKFKLFRPQFEKEVEFLEKSAVFTADEEFAVNDLFKLLEKYTNLFVGHIITESKDEIVSSSSDEDYEDESVSSSSDEEIILTMPNRLVSKNASNICKKILVTELKNSSNVLDGDIQGRMEEFSTKFQELFSLYESENCKLSFSLRLGKLLPPSTLLANKEVKNKNLYKK